MKTLRKSAILTLLTLVCGVCSVTGQPVEKKKTPVQVFMAEMEQAYTDMILKAKEKKKKLPCDVRQIFGPQAIPGSGNIRQFQMTLPTFATPSSDVDDRLKPHSFKSNVEFVLQAIGQVQTFEQFVARISRVSLDRMTEDVKKEFKRYYKRLKGLMEWWSSGDKKDMVMGPCKGTAEYFQRITRYAYPIISWEIKTVVTIDCDCKMMTGPDRFDKATYEYTASTVGTVTSTLMSFGKATNPQLKLLNYKCCPTLEQKKKDHGMHIEDEKPAYYVGVNGGFGFQDEFDATGFCLTADYVHHVADMGNGGLYIGGGAGYETMSGTDFQMNGFMVGPTAELFTPINDSGNLLWLNSVSGYYSFGDREVFGFESTYTGFDAVFRSGLNFRISSRVMVGVEIPIITWRQRTFKEDMPVEIMDPYGEGMMFESNEQKQSGFDFLLDNGNPIKIGVRLVF